MLEQDQCQCTNGGGAGYLPNNFYLKFLPTVECFHAITSPQKGCVRRGAVSCCPSLEVVLSLPRKVLEGVWHPCVTPQKDLSKSLVR